MADHPYNSDVWEAEAEGLLWVQAQCGLHGEFHVSLNQGMRHFLKTSGEEK